MTTQEFRKKSSLQIFLSYFRPHWKLFAMDLVCALMISLIDRSTTENSAVFTLK